jgi:hypothetical protein
MIDLYNSSGTRIAEDNDWKDSQEVAIEASGFSPSDSREAAIMSALAPGPTPQLFAALMIRSA